MSYCLSPSCQDPQNTIDARFCRSCGQRLLLGDRYRALRLIGRGGFGRTFLSVDEYIPSRPRCVIKQFFPHETMHQHSRKAAELFQQEAMRLDQLGQHPQIPKLLAHFTQDDTQYLVQTYIDGPTLEQELTQTGPFDEAKIRHLLDDLLPVLQFIHDRHVIHRDIKPANIIRQRRDGRIMLVDFGASKFTTETNLGRTATVIGSAGYSAPEQVAGKAMFASDVYGLGVTCLHLLTQVPPFDLFSFVEGEWIWQDYVQHPVSPELAALLNRMVQPTINRRYRSAIAVLSDLHPGEAISTASPDISTAPPPISLPPSTTPTPWACANTLVGHSNSVAAIALHPQGRIFATGGFDRLVKLWHLDSGQLLGNLMGHVRPVVALAFSPDGESLLSGGVDDAIKVWNPQAGGLRYTLTDQIQSSLSLSLAISPDGQTVASGSDSCTLQLWQFATGRLVRTLTQERAITCVALTPDGHRLVTGSSDNAIRIWDFWTGELLAVLEGHHRDVNAIAISGDGRLLVSGSSDHAIKLWDLHTPTLICTLSGHLDWVKAVAFSPNGLMVASGSGDHTIKLWDLTTGKATQTLIGHNRDVNAIAFTPDGQTLISGSSDRTIKLWRYGAGSPG